MTPAEAAALLTIASAYDNRKPDADQARAWALVLDGLRFEDCRDVIVSHYRKSRDWLMPVDIVTGVKSLRRARILEYGPIEPPRNLDPDDDRAYAEWYRETMRRIGDGEDVPKPEAVPAGRQVNYGELMAATPEARERAIRRARAAMGRGEQED